MGSIDQANEKWKRKTAAAGPAWEQGKNDAISRDAYAKGFTSKGYPAPNSMNSNWKKELGAATQSDFTAGVNAAASAEKWKNAFTRALGR